MQPEPLIIKETLDRHGNPLAVVENFPGLYADCTPEQLRQMGEALLAFAERLESSQFVALH